MIYVHYPLEGASKHDNPCESINISAGIALEGHNESRDWIPEWDFTEKPCLGDFYHFCLVLWIEWQGNISYRKGLGRVSKEIWDDVSKGEVEVLLGQN